MKIAIWGAGGIGCYYGARLQMAGHQITYIARGEHLKALQTNGLNVEHETLQFHGPVNASDQSEWMDLFSCDHFDLIIITLKANVTAEVMQQAKAWLEKGRCPILSLQNGVENEQLIASVIGEERTLGGLAVRIGGHIVKPGYVEARGVAQIVMGEWPVQNEQSELGCFADDLVKLFNDAEIPTTLSSDIRRELWRKLLINNGVNPLSALTGLDTRSLTRNPAYKKVVYKMMQEAASAAKVEGVSITDADVDEMFKLISEFDAIKTSMLVDKEKGRPLELDGICGAVIRRAAEPEQTLMTEFINELLVNS